METKVEQIARERKSLTERVKVGQAIERLRKNKDFRLVIEDLFFTENCARQARNSISPALSQEAREHALGESQAAGWLEGWLIAQTRMAKVAADSLNQLDDMEYEMFQEDDE